MLKPTSSTNVANFSNITQAYDSDAATFANGVGNADNGNAVADFFRTIVGQQACIGVRIDWEQTTGGAASGTTLYNKHTSGTETIGSHTGGVFPRVTETFYFSPAKRWTTGAITIEAQVGTTLLHGSAQLRIYEIDLLLVDCGAVTVIDG